MRKFAIATILMTVLGVRSAAADTTTDANTDRYLRKLATELLFEVPPNRKVAVRPFFADETDLPPDVADHIYNALSDATFKASAGDHTFVERTNLLKIQRSREEFYESDLEQLLRAARADVEIICTPAPHPSGVRLSCNATDIHQATTLGRAQIVLPIDTDAVGARPYNLALNSLVKRLAKALPDLQDISRTLIRDNATGTQTDLAAWLGEQLILRLKQRVADRVKTQEAAFERNKALHDGDAAPARADGSYNVKGKLFHLDAETLQLMVAFTRDGRTVAKDSTKIAAVSLPEKMFSVDRRRDRVYRAVGNAVISDRLDAAAAKRAARNLARARIVSQALDMPAPAFDAIRNEADAAFALTSTLNQGIPVDERFRSLSEPGTGGQVAIELRARVLPVGAIVRPALQARLSKSTYRAMEPIYLDIQSDATTYLGIYSWGADNRIVRLYPNETRATLAVAPETPLLLPRPGEGQLLSRPLPIADNPEDHEAVIVVAANKQADFDNLAPLAGATFNQTLDTSITGSRFFNALGKLDVGRLSLTVLPYQVRQ